MTQIPANGQLLSRLRAAYGIGEDELSRYLKISPNKIEEIESPHTESIALGIGQMLAQLYGMSVFELNKSAEHGEAPPLPDFRTDELRPARMGIYAWRAYWRARNIQTEVEDILNDEPSIHRRQEFSLHTLDELPTSVGKTVRRELGLDWQIQTCTHRNALFYDTLRFLIERLGINVIEAKYPLSDSRGFCLVSDTDGADVICVNAQNTTRRSRVFTLMHELIHVLLRRHGISDFTFSRNQIERFCNEAAAEALMPKVELEHFFEGERLDFDLLRSAATRMGISQYSLAVRVEHLRLAPKGFLANWLQYVRQNINEFGADSGQVEAATDDTFLDVDLIDRYFDDTTDAVEFRRQTSGSYHTRVLGVGISSLALAALDLNIRDEIDVYRSFRIKPKQIESVERAVRRRERMHT